MTPSAIGDALASRPIDEERLRRAVWTYVSNQRHAGATPGRVITALTELVSAARLTPLSMQQSVMRAVILWCVEAYFGHLDGDVFGRGAEAFADMPR